MLMGIMFHWGRNKRDLQEIISKASNFKERAKFPSRIKTIVSRKFRRWQTQFQSKRLVMLQTDVYVTTDFYQAKQQDKPRIIWRYKINMLLLVSRGGGGTPIWKGGGWWSPRLGGWGGGSHMKGVGMLVVSLRGVTFGFWSQLGCSGQNVIILSCKGLF